MELEDFFTFKDFARTMLLASALFLIIGTMYGVFIHAMYSSQVMSVKRDLMRIKNYTEIMAQKEYEATAALTAGDYKKAQRKTEKLVDKVNPPPISPSSYTYFNYWVASAAFVQPKITDDVKGLSNETQKAFNELDQGEVLGGKGWWGREVFNIGDQQLLPAKPQLQTHFWSFYIFVFLISVATAFLVIKEDYELPTLPEAIYGVFMPLPFFIIFSLTSLVSYLAYGLESAGINLPFLKFLHPTQINLLALLLSFVIMSMICSLGSITAVAIRSQIEKAQEEIA